MQHTTPPAPGANWRARFFSLWGTQALSQLGSAVVQFALIWWITKTTGSATALAIASLVGLLPNVLLGPIAGVASDRWSRKAIMLIADSISMLCAILMGVMFWTGAALALWPVYALMFVRSATGAFQRNANSASTPLLVPAGQLPRMAGLNSLLEGSLNIAAPVISAFLMIGLPMQGMMLIDVFTALPALLTLLAIRIPQPKRADADAAAQQGVLSDLREGLSFTLKWRGLMLLMLQAMLINFLLTPTAALTPLLVTQHLGGGAPELASLEAALGVAVIIGGVVLTAWGGFKHPRRGRIMTSLIALIFLGVGVIVIGMAQPGQLWMAMGGMALTGFMMVLTNGPLGSVFQSAVPNHMLGRVSSLLGTASMLMSPLSLIVSGPLVDVIGIRPWYIVGGVFCVIVALLALVTPAIMNIEAGPDGGGISDFKFRIPDSSEAVSQK
jgi:MFS transporter, DHA3 family, macrolide efflux protein